MSITTRRGDSGETDLLYGCRVKKDFPRIAAIGDVDELNAALGLVRLTVRGAVAVRVVPEVQQELIFLMGELAVPLGEEERYARTHPAGITAESVARLDAVVRELEAAGGLVFKGWALPGEGGSMAGAHCDVARTVCRRAERAVVSLEGTPEAVGNVEIVRYLNRLSDVLWLMARVEERSEKG